MCVWVCVSPAVCAWQKHVHLIVPVALPCAEMDGTDTNIYKLVKMGKKSFIKFQTRRRMRHTHTHTLVRGAAFVLNRNLERWYDDAFISSARCFDNAETTRSRHKQGCTLFW